MGVAANIALIFLFILIGGVFAAAEMALVSLREATPNKGGHKEIAVQLIEQAIGEVNAGIRFANQHGGGGR